MFDEFIFNVQQQIINPIITLIALAAFLVFVWGVVDYIRGAADPKKRQDGQMHMVWGIIGLVIIFGARAILAILVNTVGIH